MTHFPAFVTYISEHALDDEYLQEYFGILHNIDGYIYSSSMKSTAMIQEQKSQLQIGCDKVHFDVER